MNIEKMREEFEAWAYSVGFDIRSRDGSYLEGATADAWLSWQASRAAIEVELPGYLEQKPYACYEGGWNDMRIEAFDAIESTGIKVKQ